MTHQYKKKWPLWLLIPIYLAGHYLYELNYGFKQVPNNPENLQAKKIAQRLFSMMVFGTKKENVFALWSSLDDNMKIDVVAYFGEKSFAFGTYGFLWGKREGIEYWLNKKYA